MTLFSYLIIAALILITIFVYIWSVYNSFIRQKVRVMSEYSNIDVQLNRRSSLLQNLADLVKAYAAHEKTTFENVAKARSAVDKSVNVSDFAKADNILNQTAKSLFVVVENYPELKASDNFQSLQSELKRTEDIIAVYREEYNKATMQYNTILQVFPNVVVAILFNFKPVFFFQASATLDNKIQI